MSDGLCASISYVVYVGWLTSAVFGYSNYYAPLDDSDDETIATAPETDSESDSDYDSDAETIVASNCSPQSSDTGGAGEGVPDFPC